MDEEWIPLPGYIGLYEISTLGKLRGVKRGKHLSPSTDKRGYLFVALSSGGKVRVYKVHRLMAIAFLGKRPEGQQIRHLDNCKTNNRKSNLSYGTVYQNTMDSYKAGTYIHKPVSPQTKRKICRLVDLGKTQREIAEECDVSISTVSKVHRARRV